MPTPSKHPVIDGVKYMPDGKEICLVDTAAGKREYVRRTEEMAKRQGWQCAICKLMMRVPTFDHANGRGAGKQDDRIVDAEGKWTNAALCWKDNGLKGSTRYAWDEFGDYVPVHRF